MPIKDLEEKIREMRIEYVKTHWQGDLSGVPDDDILGIYAVMNIIEIRKEMLDKQ